jgi:hypothetical protein
VPAAIRPGAPEDAVAAVAGGTAAGPMQTQVDRGDPGKARPEGGEATATVSVSCSQWTRATGRGRLELFEGRCAVERRNCMQSVTISSISRRSTQ